MSSVFISYKREDETRVGRLVQALEQAGFSVWWDRNLQGGQNWQQQIESALKAAQCVIVVWTQASVAPAGEFVRDEARRAKSLGVLVPVLMDKVAPPLGFGEVQAIDLTHWKRSLRDPFFKDLCAAVQAKLDKREVPPAKGPMQRLQRRVLYSSLGTILGAAVIAFGFNFLGIQHYVCTLPILQPQVSDVCGAVRLGNRPTKTERVAWEGRERGNCEALRAHVTAFPEGVYRNDAATMISARQVKQVEYWTPVERRLVLSVRLGVTTSKTENEARAEAIGRASAGAERLCKGFTATLSYRLNSSKPDVQIWNCETVGGRVACGFEGEAVCQLDERGTRLEETCGGLK